MKLAGIEWDENKNEINKREHEGLGFEDAQYVFTDPERLERFDRSEKNTSGEERWQTLGMVGKVLFVVYTEIGEIRRIISARLAINMRGGVTMGIIQSTVRVGQKPPKEVIKRIREIAKKPIHYTADCPKSTPEALKEFAMQRAEMNRRKKKKSVTLRISPDILESYKTMGSGYTGIMADVLKYAVSNPNILTQATR